MGRKEILEEIQKVMKKMKFKEFLLKKFPNVNPYDLPQLLTIDQFITALKNWLNEERVYYRDSAKKMFHQQEFYLKPELIDDIE